MRKEPKILLIIPAYNEAENIVDVYKTILSYNQSHQTKYDVIIINDGSKDQTESICVAHKIPMISLIHNLGIGGAVQTGYKYAVKNDYDIAVQFDGDGQHDVSCVEMLVEKIRNKESDFVVGSRFVDHSSSEFKSSQLRRIGIRLISRVIYIMTGKTILDTTSGFRAANKQIIADFANCYPPEYPEPITNAEIIKKGYKVSEVAVSMNERKAGMSSIHTWKNIYYMLNVIVSVCIVATRRYK